MKNCLMLNSRIALAISAAGAALISSSLPGAVAGPDTPADLMTASAPDAGGGMSAEAKLQLARFSPDKMDRSVDPGVDFLKFAAGKWYETTKIPADKSRWGGFDELADANWARIRSIVEDAARETGQSGSVRQKVGDFFTSAIDTDRINELGLKPIADELKFISGVKSLDELMRFAAGMQLRIGNPFFNVSFLADQKKSDIYGFYLSQGGMSLPSKEYYFSDKFARERWEFVGHVAKMFELAGESRAGAYSQAETIFALEKTLAENAKMPVDLRDRLANYNKTTIAEAVATYPGIPLQLFVTEIGLPPAVGEVIIGQPKFMEGVSKLLQERPLDDWKAYLRWHHLRGAAPYLSEPFERESFRFNGTVLNGTPEQEPRWQRAARVVDRSIGEALGELYVEKFFPPASKARMMEMIENIKTVMRDRLQKVEWMTEPTRREALAKFDRFAPMIGYPEKWRDYSAVEIKRDDYYGNVVRSAEAESRRVIRRTGRKVDKREWSMTP
ncbi:MAG: M13 family metallopeptidase, partial [Opitutaceae bacterium]